MRWFLAADDAEATVCVDPAIAALRPGVTVDIAMIFMGGALAELVGVSGDWIQSLPMVAVSPTAVIQAMAPEFVAAIAAVSDGDVDRVAAAWAADIGSPRLDGDTARDLLGELSVLFRGAVANDLRGYQLVDNPWERQPRDGASEPASSPGHAPLVVHIVERTEAGLTALAADVRDDAYALSFWVTAGGDDARHPALMVSANTEAQVAASTRGDDEARWNFAFWLQEPLAMVGDDDDPAGEALIDAFFLGLDDLDEDSELELVDAFAHCCVAAATALHERGTISAAFGRPIPIIVHDLEYASEVFEWTEQANPGDLTTAFLDWSRTAY